MSGRPRSAPLAVAAAVLGILAIGHWVAVPQSTYSNAAWLNVGHAVVFAAAAWLFTSWPPLPGRPWWFWGVVLAIVGFVLEASQVVTTRDASASDYLRDLAGIGCGTVLALSRGGGWRRRAMLWSAGFVLLAASVSAPLRLVVAYQLRDLDFPVIDSLAGEWRYRLRPVESSLRVSDTDGARRLVVDLTTARFSGVAWSDPVPDWRGFETVVLDVRPADAAPIDLTLRIHDAGHNHQGTDRFRASLTVPADGAVFEFPLADVRAAPEGREMDLGAIRAVILYAKELDRDRSVEVASLRLR